MLRLERGDSEVASLYWYLELLKKPVIDFGEGGWRDRPRKVSYAGGGRMPAVVAPFSSAPAPPTIRFMQFSVAPWSAASRCIFRMHYSSYVRKLRKIIHIRCLRRYRFLWLRSIKIRSLPLPTASGMRRVYFQTRLGRPIIHAGISDFFPVWNAGGEQNTTGMRPDLQQVCRQLPCEESTTRNMKFVSWLWHSRHVWISHLLWGRRRRSTTMINEIGIRRAQKKNTTYQPLCHNCGFDRVRGRIW